MVTVRWDNGETDEAPTWQALLDHVRDTQWGTYDTEEDFRVDMAVRALRWSSTEIDHGGTPEHFFMELERARLVTIERD